MKKTKKKNPSRGSAKLVNRKNQRKPLVDPKVLRGLDKKTKTKLLWLATMLDFYRDALREEIKKAANQK
jgi:hypothetical protein